jgi:peptidoglycan hydrolase CwlO-like protein
MPVKDDTMIKEYTTSTTNIATEIAADLAHGAYAISYDSSMFMPDTVCTTTTIGTTGTTCTCSTPEYVFYSTTPPMYEEYVNKAVDKIDRHVDKLEEDIDYFNKKLEKNDKDYTSMENTLINMSVTIRELTEKIESMKKEIDLYESLISDDHLAVMELKDRGIIK